MDSVSGIIREWLVEAKLLHMLGVFKKLEWRKQEEVAKNIYVLTLGELNIGRVLSIPSCLDIEQQVWYLNKFRCYCTTRDSTYIERCDSPIYLRHLDEDCFWLLNKITVNSVNTVSQNIKESIKESFEYNYNSLYVNTSLYEKHKVIPFTEKDKIKEGSIKLALKERIALIDNIHDILHVELNHYLFEKIFF